MKSYDYDAVVCDGEVYCVGCEPEGYELDENGENEDIHPVFADSEWDYYPTCANCGHRHDYVSLTSEGERYERAQAGPQEEDITISDSGPLGSLYSVGVVNGEFIGEYRTWEDAVQAIKAYMEEERFFPTVWRISDHGNAEVIEL